MKYRAEIDGLRALAVVPVILFHAGFELFSGGFVGVDVFFVISGYLITTILIEDIENNRFSIATFYERRARRILPALIFVMLVCIPFAWIWMLPNQMKDFSQSLVAVSLFASNILFWRDSGYFDIAAEEKPLLHTWSLAVEEQYYLLFPIFLILAWRFGKERVFWTIVVMAAISLLLSEWGWRNMKTANFYLAPTRVWELFAGSIAAFVVQKRGVQRNDTLSLLGLAAVIFSIFAYDEATPFPSVYALMPVIGVVLIVLFADRKTFVARLLSTNLFVSIGLISYSAYLWHQPLLAFARIQALEPSALLLTMCSLASLVFAAASWSYIEKPFRDREKISRRNIFLLAAIGGATFVALGVLGHKTNGFAQREGMRAFSDLMYDRKTLGYVECSNSLDRVAPKLNYCMKSAEKVDAIVFGDSHADDKFDGIAKGLSSYSWMLLGNSSCPPLREIRIISPDKTHCTEILKKAFVFLENQPDVKAVVLSFAHMSPLDELIAADHIKKGLKSSDGLIEDLYEVDAQPIDAFYNGLERAVKSLLKHDVNVIIAIDIPELHFLPEDCLKGNHHCEFSRASVIDRQVIHRSKLAVLKGAYPQIRLFDPLNIFCQDGSVCTIIKDTRSLYRDSHHLSHYGSRIYGAAFSKWFSFQDNDRITLEREF